MKPLTYRDAIAYVFWRAADQNGRPIHIREAEETVDHALAVCPRSLRRIAARPYKTRTRPRRDT